MKSFKSLLVLGAMAMASSMAWGQTVVANMQQLIDGATVKTAEVSTDWETDVTGGAVYKFTRTAENAGTYLGAITNDEVANALKGNKVVTVAAWVYGRPNGCIFSMGEQNTGVKFMLTSTSTGANFKTTTKGVADFDELSFNMPADQWNLVAFSVYGKGSGTSSYRYYQGTTDNNFYTRVNKTMATMNDASLLAIGSGNQNGPREIFSSELANLTVIESDGYLGNAKIAELVGAAPTKKTPTYTAEQIADLQTKIDNLTPGVVGYPDAYSEAAQNIVAFTSYFGDGVDASNYAAAQAALEALYNCTDVVLPEEGKYYEIKAVYHDGKKQYLGFDGTKLSITDAKPMGGSVTFKAESVEGSNIVLSIDGHYVHWTAGDDPEKTADTDGLNETLDANLNTLVLTKATPGTSTGSSTPKATSENLFGLLQIQGKSSGSKYSGNLFYFVTRNDLAGVGNYVAGNAGDKFFDDNWDHKGHNRTTYFEFTEVEAPAADVPATQDELLEAGELLFSAGWIGYPAEDNEATIALSAAIEKEGVTATELGAAVLAYKNCTDVVLPEKNQFYQIQGASTSGLIGGGLSGNAVKLDAEQFYADPQTVDLSSLYYYSEEGYLINYNGGRALKGSAIAGVNETPDVYTFCHETLTDLGTLSIKNQEGKYLIDVNHNLATTDAPVGAATNWNINAYGYAPIVVGSTGYATAYLPYNLASAPEYDIEAVYVVYEDGNVLQAEEIDCIPARVPVIVKTYGEQRCFGKGMGGNDSWEPSDEVKASLAKNVLSGSLLAIEKPTDALVLGYEDEQIGFYGFSGTVLAGFKAYYQPAAASNGLRIRFDNTLTAIESAVETAQGHQIFDLQGRRVNGAAHGLFIQNGKKVIK